MNTKIYNIGASSIRHYFDFPIDYYFCPLCLKGYPQPFIKMLSLEHVPQKSIGGKKLCLTCKTSCNSQAGHLYEKDLVAREKLKELIRAISSFGRYRTKVKFALENIEINTKLTVAEGKLKLNALS